MDVADQRIGRFDFEFIGVARHLCVIGRVRTEANPRLQAEGFGGCRIEFDYAVGLGRGFDLQAEATSQNDSTTSRFTPRLPYRPLWGLRDLLFT